MAQLQILGRGFCFSYFAANGAVRKHANRKLSSVILQPTVSTAACLERKSYSTEATQLTKAATDKSDVAIPSKKVTNSPFVKNLFLGKFDTNMLVFPEALEKHEVDELSEMVKPVEKFFADKVKSNEIDRTSKIPDEVMQGLKSLGLFGLQIPTDYGGLGLNATQYARFQEIVGNDGAIGVMLGAHQSIGLKGILMYGTDEQKEKYLPKLASGEHVAAFALTEPSGGSDAASIKLKATLAPDGKHYMLNGTKTYITNGGIAEVFTVFAKTPMPTATNPNAEKMTAFIVERAFGGVTHGKPEDKMGIRGSNTCEVYFENTPVPIENVLGEVGHGFKVAVNILNTGRFSMGSGCAGGLKKIIGLCAEQAIARQQFGFSLKDFELIKAKVTKMTVTTYAMESMSYVTAAIIDKHVKPDSAVEAAIVKVFASEHTWHCLSEALQLYGGMGYMRQWPFEQYMRDIRILQIFEGTNEILRLFIALQCLQHAGVELREVVRKLRNPMNNVGFLWKMSMERIAQSNKDKPRLLQKLHNHVHPNMGHLCERMEVLLVKFKRQVEEYLAKYTDKIIEQQYALRRFADIAIDLYASTCVISRASRSVCIGLKHYHEEFLMAEFFCNEAATRIEQNLKELEASRSSNYDEHCTQIADTVFKNHGYPFAHPLERNW